MRPMNTRKDPEASKLIAAYEEQFKSGEIAFFEEKAYLKIIDFYEKDNQLDKALEVVDSAIAHHSYSVDCYARKAELLIVKGMRAILKHELPKLDESGRLNLLAELLDITQFSLNI